MTRVFKRRKGAFVIRMTDPPEILIRHLQLRRRGRSRSIQLLLLLGGTSVLIRMISSSIRVGIEIGTRVRVRVPNWNKRLSRIGTRGRRSTER